MKHAYVCPECDGERIVVCDCCDNEVDCDHCTGSGLDPEKIDVAKWLAASDALARQHGSSWEWRHNGVVRGRTNGWQTLTFSEFAVNPAPVET